MGIDETRFEVSASNASIEKPFDGVFATFWGSAVILDAGGKDSTHISTVFINILVLFDRQSWRTSRVTYWWNVQLKFHTLFLSPSYPPSSIPPIPLPLTLLSPSL